MDSILVHNSQGKGSYGRNVFDMRTQHAYSEAQNVKNVMSKTDSKGNPLFSSSKNQTIQVLTHKDGSVGISGATPQKTKLLQDQLDSTYGKGKYNVQSETLSDKNGIIKAPNGNKPGACAEPNCAVTASTNTSPITGASTVWRGKGQNNHFFQGGKADEMRACPTCHLNKDKYHDKATGNN